MTIQQIRYVVTVAECNSMNKAAEKLFISQPSLSSAVKELEDEYGDIYKKQQRSYSNRCRK